jgi:alpha-ketoglutarate-dependent taurine dioxygenase
MAVPATYRDDPRAWTGATLTEDAWRLPVPAACVAELEAVVEYLERHPMPVLLLDPDEHALDACRALIAHARRRLDAGPGIVVLDRLPVEHWSRERIEGVFWLLGRLIARPVVQTFDGKILVEVTDTGVKKTIGVRGFRTNVAQPPHVDNSFNHAPPDYVSLLSLRGAREGGLSRFVSFYTVHNRLEARDPRLLGRLYQPFYQDRQGDFWPDEPQTVSYPVFALDPDLRCRYTHFTIPAGYQTAGVPFEGETRAAFEAMTEAVQDPDLACEFLMRPGELQVVNNRYCGHGRTGYIDDPDAPRLLLRLWHRERGRRPYGGI